MGDATRYLGATGGVTNMNGNGIALIDQPIYIHIMRLEQCHVYHPQVITIIIGGINLPFPVMASL